MEKEFHRNAFISTKYLFPAATAHLIVHCTGQGDEIKKRSYVFIVGLLIGCTAVIVCDCLLQDCLWEI